ncbi:hypothetical protein LZ32DRAFT_608862 [Colletotrichum eremochloae]|nr:hypothetical protein LZ32DRAFT_608862 [Colletotrichum eremochloae]
MNASQLYLDHLHVSTDGVSCIASFPSRLFRPSSSLSPSLCSATTYIRNPFSSIPILPASSPCKKSHGWPQSAVPCFVLGIQQKPKEHKDPTYHTSRGIVRKKKTKKKRTCAGSPKRPKLLTRFLPPPPTRTPALPFSPRERGKKKSPRQ